MSQYKVGSVAINSSTPTTVTGTGTLWNALDTPVTPQMTFKLYGLPTVYPVESIDYNAQTLTLVAPGYIGSTVADQTYQITRDFTANFGIPEISPNDVDWATYITRGLRQIDTVMATVINEGIIFKGVWNATTNTPVIPTAVIGNLGWLYMVTVAGTTNIDGNASWSVGDTLVSNGSAWSRIPTQSGQAAADEAAASADAADAYAYAASLSAIAADNSADAASISETNAANIASGVVATSTTGWTIAVESKLFSTQSGKQFVPGSWVVIASAANVANYGTGQVTTYTGTALTVDVTTISGSGSYSDWNITLSGPKGPQGIQGEIGETGENGTGTGTVTSVTAGAGMTQSGTSTINPTLDIVSHVGTAGTVGTLTIGVDSVGVSLGNTSTTACAGNDTRLSDPRTPASHATGSHSDWPATVSMIELGYLDGVSSAIQTQIGTKIGDASSDGNTYARKDGAWIQIVLSITSGKIYFMGGS